MSGRSFSYLATTSRGSDESQRYVTNENPKLEAKKTVLVRFAAVRNTVSRKQLRPVMHLVGKTMAMTRHVNIVSVPLSVHEN